MSSDRIDPAVYIVPEVAEDFLKNVDKFTTLHDYKPTECQNCDVNFCMKCEASNFFSSTKSTYEEKWTDYNSNQTCSLFKFADKYNKTIRYKKGKITNVINKIQTGKEFITLPPYWFDRIPSFSIINGTTDCFCSTD